MIKYGEGLGLTRDDIFGLQLVKDYPFTDEYKMMGKAYKKDNQIILAAKGSPESIIKICDLNTDEKNIIVNSINEMQKQGLRVIAVAKGLFKGEEELRENLTEFNLEYVGLVGLMDPPKENVKEDIEMCRRAGIRVVMITGDNGVTASSIAKEVGMGDDLDIITGAEIESMSEEELKERVKTVSIFSRVVPEHKMKIVNAFKANGEVVAMTGDGVNDAPALKRADIGIAMGKRGSEVSREAADIILMDDNFRTIAETIKDGRKIYDNIKKAIGYILVIHIPIALSSLAAPLLKMDPNSFLLLPLHVLLLEMVIDPTCSIVLEREPAEDNIMTRGPRSVKESVVSKGLLFKSFVQGVVIFLVAFITFYELLQNGVDVSLARTVGVLTIILSNVFLVIVNTSDTDFAYKTIGKLSKDNVMRIAFALMILFVIVIVYSPLNGILKLYPLTLSEMLMVISLSFVSVFWYEFVKLFKKIRG